MSNRRFRFNLFKLNSYSSPHKNSSCSFPILSMPACVHLAHHDTSPSRPQPSSCSAIPDSSHSWATSSLSEKPAEKKKKRKACWLLWKCFWNLVSACPLLCCLPDGGHQPLNRITASMAPRALSPLQNVYAAIQKKSIHSQSIYDRITLVLLAAWVGHAVCFGQKFLSSLPNYLTFSLASNCTVWPVTGILLHLSQ